MAINEKLTARVREALAGVKEVEEKKMFRGVVFMVNGKMCLTVGDDRMMCRIGPATYDAALKKTGCTPVIMGGRPMKGFVYINEKQIGTKARFDYWINLALEFNTVVKASPKKKKKKLA